MQTVHDLVSLGNRRLTFWETDVQFASGLRTRENVSSLLMPSAAQGREDSARRGVGGTSSPQGLSEGVPSKGPAFRDVGLWGLPLCPPVCHVHRATPSSTVAPGNSLCIVSFHFIMACGPEGITFPEMREPR